MLNLKIREKGILYYMLFFRKNDKDEICGLFLIDEREIQGGFFFFFFKKKGSYL